MQKDGQLSQKFAKTFLRGRFRISESMNRPPLSERRSVLLFGRCIKAGVQIIDVFAVHPLLGQTQRLASTSRVEWGSGAANKVLRRVGVSNPPFLVNN